MIDLHCHILDETPCGPDSFAESLKMCRAAVTDGVKTIVATPRWEAGRSEPPLPFENCLRKLERLEVEMCGALALKLGFALQFSPDLPKLVKHYGQKLTLAGKRHLLVSLSSLGVPPEVERVWKSLSAAGFSVVLARPECNTVLRRHAPRLACWVSEGMILQIDAASVAGVYGREVRRFALECLRKYEGRAVVASNAHHGIEEKSSLGKALKELTVSVGERQARGFVTDVPSTLIGDGTGRKNSRYPSFWDFTTSFRSIGPIKAIIGDS